MERESQPTNSGLIALQELLAGRISETNLYRFCQLVEQVSPEKPPLGSTAHPSDDAIRFRPHAGMGFPVSELRSFEIDSEHPERPATVRTWLLGLYGVDSPLPTAYLDDITLRREGHDAVEAFLDIFNHRIFTQFYRIWRKYSYPATFEAGGKDKTSQCLLGLIGLGIPGTATQIATPVSRFLALLGVMRMPTRTAEGISALVKLLAPNTSVRVIPHSPQRVPLAEPAGLSRKSPTDLSQYTVLGRFATDVNSQVLLQLSTEDPNEAQHWLPDGQLHTDLCVLLRVYLGWRCNAKLRLTLPTTVLPLPALGEKRLKLGFTTLLGLGTPTQSGAIPSHVTVNLGRYQGIYPNTIKREKRDVKYRF